MKMLSLVAIAAAIATGSTAHAATNLVLNGGFEDTTLTNSAQFGTRFGGQTVANWTTTGYNFVFFSGTADTSGAIGEYGFLALHGPANGTANGLPAASPFGGNFIAADGAFDGAGDTDVGVSVEQLVNGLTIGSRYNIGFAWAGAQQLGFTGDTTEQLRVSFGSEVQSTGVLNNVSQGFTGWQIENFSFTATSTSQVLSFLAVGTPRGLPPFVLFDGVSVTAVPEASTWALLIAGFGLVGVAARRRRTVVLAA